MFRNKLQQVTKKYYKKNTITKKHKNIIIEYTNSKQVIQCNEIMTPIYSFEKKYEINELKLDQKQQKIKLFIDYYKKENKFTPKNDYYNHVNSNWIEKMNLIKTQNYLTKIDTYRLTQDKVFNEINDIYKNSIKKCFLNLYR